MSDLTAISNSKNIISGINSFPRCSDPSIVNQILLLHPCIDIQLYETGMVFQGDDGRPNPRAVKSFNNMLAKLNNVLTPTNNTGLKIKEIKDSQIEFHSNLYGFYSLLKAHRSERGEFPNIPISNSPQIKVNNGSGWTNEQSLISFIQQHITGDTGLLGGALQYMGISGGIGASLTLVETLGGMMGWSPRVSPYFSFKDNPFGDKPSLFASLYLINDCKNSLELNSLFLNTIIKNSLITKTGKDGESGGRFFGRWRPPKLFDVGLKWGATPEGNDNITQYVKKFHLCTLNASINPEGVIRQGIPDAYKVDITFTSILPDTGDLWQDGNFPDKPFL